MARKRAPGFEAQREDILAAAARLFASQGFSATSMNQVAEACGVAKPTLYHYFQDKNDLLAQICDSHVHALLALVEEVKAQRLAPDAVHPDSLLSGSRGSGGGSPPFGSGARIHFGRRV